MKRSTVSVITPSCSHGKAWPPWRVPPCSIAKHQMRLDPPSVAVATYGAAGIARRLRLLICLILLSAFSTASAWAQATADNSPQLAPTRKAPETSRWKNMITRLRRLEKWRPRHE